MTMGELTKRINRDKSTTTVLVRKLKNAGLIQVLADKSDKRNKILALTEKGTEYTQLTAEISRELIQTFYKGFADTEKEQFFSFLKRIEGNF